MKAFLLIIMSGNPHDSSRKIAKKFKIRETLFTNRLGDPIQSPFFGKFSTEFCRSPCCNPDPKGRFNITNHQWRERPSKPIYNVPEYFTRPVHLVDATRPEILEHYGTNTLISCVFFKIFIRNIFISRVSYIYERILFRFFVFQKLKS